MLTMPDGVKLCCDVYRPHALGKFPVIITRTPYGKNGKMHPYKKLAELFAGNGYVFVVQDVRGKYESEGEFSPYKNEAIDGHTTVNWAGEAPWSNGKVALFGFSYLGSCAWLAAKYKSPYLKTLITMFTSQNTHSVWIDNDIPFLKGPLMWLAKNSTKTDNKAITNELVMENLWKIPVDTLDEELCGKQIPFYKNYLKHLTRDEFWKQFSIDDQIEKLDFPVLIMGGWYDPFLAGTIEDYQRMIESKVISQNHQSQLQIGPWAHNPAQKFKGIDFGKKASFNALILATLNWCNYWLKDDSEAISLENKINYFVMGLNEWRESKEWPPSDITYVKYYLSMEKGFINRKKGHLSTEHSDKTQRSEYTYDPKDPILFPGSYLLRNDEWIGPVDQDEIIARDDILIYNTPLLEKDLIIAGPVKLIIFVSSSAVDTDFCAKICDVYLSGKAYNLASGFFRMRFRNSNQNPELMEPDKIYRIEITMRSVANGFMKNHRIQLQIASSDFPIHNRNLNTGLSCESSSDVVVADQAVYTGGEYESYLLLPVLNQ